MRVLICSDEGRRIFDMAAAIKRMTEGSSAEIFVLHVLHPGEGGRTPEDQQRLAEERKGAAETALEMAGLAGEVIVETRDPLVRVHQHVLRIAQRLDPDMIVVASKRAGGILDLVLGGVAQELIRHSRIPVLVVRPDEERRRS